MLEFFNRLFTNKPKPFSKFDATYEWEGNKGRSPSGQFNLFMFDKIIGDIFPTFDEETSPQLSNLRFAAYAYLVDHPLSYVESYGGLKYWEEDGRDLEEVLQGLIRDGVFLNIGNPRVIVQSSAIVKEGRFTDAEDWLGFYSEPERRSDVMSVKIDLRDIPEDEMKARSIRFFRALSRFIIIKERCKVPAIVGDKQVDLFEQLKDALSENRIQEIVNNGGDRVLIRAIDKISKQRQRDIKDFVEQFERRKRFVVPAWKKVMFSSINKYGDYDPLPLEKEKEEYFEYEYGAYGLPAIGNKYYKIPELEQYLFAVMEDKKSDLNDYPEDGHLFEVWVAEKLISLDWDAHVTSGSGDQGVDVIAEKDGIRVGVQCKQYAGTVGNSAVQQIISGKGFYEVDKGVVVSTGKYTRSARQLAEASGIGLLSHLDLEFFDDKVKDLPS